jgi:hypothetical protein
MEGDIMPLPLVACLLLLSVSLAPAADQKYTGPRPPKPDVPYLLHADNLIETEAVQAQEEDRNREMLNSIPGASSPVRTPLAEPIFLIDAQKIVPEKLELYRFEVRRGRREITFPKKQSKNAPRPIRVMITQIEGKLYRLEANETLENGEYGLSPDGSEQVFAFQVY